MTDNYIQLTAIIITLIILGIACFQILLALGFPLGEAAWGGSHRILPLKLRIASTFSALILLFFGYVFLQHTGVFFSSDSFLPTKIVVWIFTVFIGVNILGNAASKSQKEKMIMTPLTVILFSLSLVIAVAG